jgi:hypothetical protein
MFAGEETLAIPAAGRSGCEGAPVTASEEHVPERRQDQRRQVVQPAFFGENRTTVRRTDDAAEVEPASTAQPDLSELPRAIPRQDYDFLTGLISMEHSG